VRLSGAMTRFRVSGAGARFTEVEVTFEGAEVDLGVANDNYAQQFVDPAGRRCRITARGLVESSSDLNFIDVCEEGRVVEITDLTKVNQSRLNKYAPFQVLRCGLKHGRRTASEDSIEIIGTAGAIPPDYDPDSFGVDTNA
jgi:hypothetical protein